MKYRLNHWDAIRDKLSGEDTGWRISERSFGFALHKPDGQEVAPNTAPADIRDAFRCFMRKSTEERNPLLLK